MTRIRQAPAALALAAAIGLGLVGLARGTWAVGGSDSACYGLMARAFASGALQPVSPLAATVPWSRGPLSLAPAGFIPSPVRAEAASPVCAPGFALLLAPLAWLGGPDGVFWATPLAGALLVWLAFRLGLVLAGPWAGATASVLVATSPIVLYQAVQPMNDITTAALWMAVVVAASRGRVVAAGLLTGLALLVRPNLAPAAVIAGLLVPTIGSKEERPRGWLGRAATFALAASPGVAALMGLNLGLYGSPLRSGYGDLETLFAAAFVPINLRRYATWLVQTHTVLPLLGVVAPVLCAAPRRRAAGFALAVAAGTALVYLAYRPFDEWWHLRFLLPAVVLLLVLSAAGMSGLAARVHPAGPLVVCCAAATVFGSLFVRTADERLAFRLQAFEEHFRVTGLLARDRLPANAVFITVFESGTVRFFAAREAVLWDSLDPAELDVAVAWLTGAGYRPYILVERDEEGPFRERFGERSRFGGLDWPPAFDVNRRARLFDPADLDRYDGGVRVPTEYVWGPVAAGR